MEALTNLVSTILSSNPTVLLVFLLCFMAVFALPSILHFFAVKGIVSELKTSMDKLDDRLDRFVDFVMENLKAR